MFTIFFFIAMSSIPTTSGAHGEDVLTTPPLSPACTTVTVLSAASSTDGTSRLLIIVEANK